MTCGTPVSPLSNSVRPTLASLGAGPLIAVLLGIACLIAALVTGALFNQQQSYVDWQAVQAWRIEWLLAGIAFFVLALFMSSARSRTR
jgi:predicted lysophospholipase L1 biosynthesis ABC-type transport system permease subunit